jgi:WD40 repeat protein
MTGPLNGDERVPDPGEQATGRGDTRPGEEVRRFEVGDGLTSQFCFRIDEGKVFFRSSGGGSQPRFMLFDYEKGIHVRRLAMSRGFGTVVLSPDGQKALSVLSSAKVVQLWEVTDKDLLRAGEELHSYEGHHNTVVAVRWLPDGRRFITAGEDGNACVWDAASRDPDADLLCCFDLHEHPITALAVSRDGRFGATGDQGGHVFIWDVESSKLICRLPKLRNPFFRRGREGVLRDAQGKPLPLRPANEDGSEISAITFFPDGKYVAVGTAASRVHVFDTETARELATHVENVGFDTDITSVAVAPDRRWILYCTEVTPIRLWDWKAGQIITSLSGHNRTGRGPRFDGQPGGVEAVAFTPDGKHALSGGEDGTIRLWKLPD